MPGANELLPVFLMLAVKQRIDDILRCPGGITDDDLERIKGYGNVLAEHGDELLYRSKKKGDTARYFNQLADAVAVCAFLPGGVTVFGEHYEVTAGSKTTHQ